MGETARNRLPLLNASAALTFLDFFYALKLIEPAIVGAVEEARWAKYLTARGHDDLPERSSVEMIERFLSAQAGDGVATVHENALAGDESGLVGCKPDWDIAGVGGLACALCGRMLDERHEGTSWNRAGTTGSRLREAALRSLYAIGNIL